MTVANRSKAATGLRPFGTITVGGGSGLNFGSLFFPVFHLWRDASYGIDELGDGA